MYSSLSMDVLFDNYHIQSAEAGNTINLELPLGPLHRALRSAINSSDANLRLTKRDGVPVLSMTIHTTTSNQAGQGGGTGYSTYGSRATSAFGGGGSGGGGGGEGGYGRGYQNEYDPFGDDHDGVFEAENLELISKREREKVITQDIPVRVLHPDTVEMIMQPTVREPDVHIQLPPLMQLKAISDRFTRLAATTAAGGGRTGGGGGGDKSPKLELSANMHGSLRLRIATEALDIESVWSKLENPALDPAQLSMPLEEHPSTHFREAGPDKWASVRVDGRDWSRVLSVGRLEGRVIACFADDHALILYVYVPNYEDATADDSVVTVSCPCSGEMVLLRSGLLITASIVLCHVIQCMRGSERFASENMGRQFEDVHPWFKRYVTDENRFPLAGGDGLLHGVLWDRLLLGYIASGAGSGGDMMAIMCITRTLGSGSMPIPIDVQRLRTDLFSIIQRQDFKED